MDIVQLVLDDHAEQRRLFALIEETDGSEKDALSAMWTRLKNLLDAHAEAEERFLYPRVLEQDSGGVDADSAEEATEDAIGDHNDIRDASEAVQQHEVGTKEWFDAVDEANHANSHHLPEEERQALTALRRNCSLEERHELGVKFMRLESEYLCGIKVVDKDVDEYLEDPQQTFESLEPEPAE